MSSGGFAKFQMCDQMCVRVRDVCFSLHSRNTSTNLMSDRSQNAHTSRNLQKFMGTLSAFLSPDKGKSSCSELK
jgi:hypothetical protein